VEDGDPRRRRRAFAEFPDPFATGAAGRHRPNDLVKYSFEAFEAWARERGCPRSPDQTPHELARNVGVHAASLARDARRLADLYCLVAYTPLSLPPESVEQLREFWQQLRHEDIVAAK
jgi:hypothetical protein